MSINIPDRHPAKRELLTLLISLLALLVTAVTAYFTYDSVRVSRSATRESGRNADRAQETSLFAQFQEEYSGVASRFPRHFLAPTFKPRRGSEDYARLEAYWFFCFSEWYATNRIFPEASRQLWTAYYAPLIMNGLEIPSLRYTVQNMIYSFDLRRGSYRNFFIAVAALARQENQPLSPISERRLGLIDKIDRPNTHLRSGGLISLRRTCRS